MSAGREIQRGLACAIALVLLSACGGGSSGTVTPRRAPAGRATVTFTMHWRATATGAHQRRPLFISPSAKSVVVEVNSGSTPAGPVTFANAPVTSGSPTTTTISIDAPAGQDDFSIALFDQPQVPGETTAVGTQLGRAEVTQTIQPGVLNTLNAVVSGIVGSVQVAPIANQPFVETLSATPPQAYALIGDQPETFVVTALDPDGNVIVPADTSAAHVDTPTVSLQPSVATSQLTITPVASDPSRFVVTATAAKISPSVVLALFGSASDGAGDHAQTNVSIDERSAVYVAIADGSASTVAVVDELNNKVPVPTGGFAGLAGPVAIAYDGDDHRVFVIDSDTVAAFNGDGTSISGYTAPHVTGANGVAYDTSNKLVYVSSPGLVSVFTPNGATPGSGPASFAAAHANAIAFVPAPTPQIAVANADPVTPSFDLYGQDGTPLGTFPIGGTAAPVAVACDPSTLTMYVTTGATIASFTLSGSGIASVADLFTSTGLAFDPNLDDLYSSERGVNLVRALTADLSGKDNAHYLGALASGSSVRTGVAIAF